MSNTQQKETIQGVVIQSLPNAMFMVRYQTPDGEAKEMLTYLAGKMTYNRIRVLIGDRVTVEIDPYGGKGKITRRG
jgi:translation initiation factor IF-1